MMKGKGANMFWRKKKPDYDILISSINKQFKNFTKKEAESYFEWYKNQLNPRIEYLRKYSGVDLDYWLILWLTSGVGS